MVVLNKMPHSILCTTAAVTLLSFGMPACAHVGPPFPIMMDRHVGPCLASVWADPNVGTGKFYVPLNARPNGAIPPDVSVRIGVRPVSGRLPEVTYNCSKMNLDRVQFYVALPFDKEEKWRVHLFVAGGGLSGETSADVDVTPPGPGPADLIIMTFPFAGFAVLWVVSMLRRKQKRARRRSEAAHSPDEASPDPAGAGPESAF